MWGLAMDGSRRELLLEEYWFHKGGVVLKFAGVESISDAERLKGLELQIQREDRAALEAAAAYVSEIVGCEVWLAGLTEPRFLGTVAEVTFGAGEAPLLVIRGPAEQEFLVPYAEEFVKRANFAEHRIEMKLPEGLLELEAPLSSEERRQQRSEADEMRSAGDRRRGRK